MAEDTEIVLSQGTKINLIQMAEDIEAFSAAMDVSTNDDETLAKLEDDVCGLLDATTKLHVKLCEDIKTRQSSWGQYMRYDGCEEMFPLISQLSTTHDTALGEDGKRRRWNGYEFKLKSKPNEHFVLRCFENGDERDVCLADEVLGPVNHKSSVLLRQRADMEAMVKEQNCSVIEYLTTQMREPLQLVVAFHLR